MVRYEPPPRRSRSTLIVILLVATLALTATGAYEAQQAARSHRVAAENVLRDYGGVCDMGADAGSDVSRCSPSIQQQLQELQRSIDRGGLETAWSGHRAVHGSLRVRSRTRDPRRVLGHTSGRRVLVRRGDCASGVRALLKRSLRPTCARRGTSRAPRLMSNRADAPAGGRVASGR